MVNSYSASKRSAVFADSHCAECMSYAMPCPTRPMPFMPAMSMGMATATASAATTSTLFGTGVTTSVSLFVASIILGLLLVGLVVLISLLLTCLTGLVRLGSLVGLIEELATNATQGD